MADFIIRFLLCNILISGIIGILLICKNILRNYLPGRIQYNLWLLFLFLLAVPFMPFGTIKFIQVFSRLFIFRNLSFPIAKDTITETAGLIPSGASNWMNDFALSVSQETPSAAGLILCGIWIAGILAMTVFVIKSAIRLHTLKKSALPLQNEEIRRLYAACLDEMNITAAIPVYSTAFLKSPIIVGLLKSRIYLPIHLISDYNMKDLRYMLLHELQHYKHKDALSIHLMNLAGVFYWFNPLVWYALREMRNDREVACDTSVLAMLKEDFYEDYGSTLINFAEKVSLTPFPFAAGLSGNMKQMRRRILNIASYEKPSVRKKICGITAFLITAAFLISIAPLLSTYAADPDQYHWNNSSARISYPDLSPYFGGYEGSFVLYDLKDDSFSIYDIEHATMRTAPDSTYKIYDALFGLEDGVITPENSFMEWNQVNYPFETWNTNQTLQSAMQSSVNWYFQSIDTQLGAAAVNSYIQKIGYGNENISGDFSSYWMESSLKISPVEQVELLTKLYCGSLGFAAGNISAVKDSILISSSEKGNLYGKTGTGRVNGQDINGWFIGYVENSEHTYFFAANIQNDRNAAGHNASEITLSILSDMNIFTR